MLRMTLVAGATALFLTACGSVPPEWNDGSSASTAMASADVGDPNRKVCKKTKVSGSQFDKKVCMTAGEWQKMQDASQAGTGEMQRNSAQSGNPSGN